MTPSPFLLLPGAVAASADAPDAGVPAHYGNPLTEQRALQAGSAIVDLSTRGVITIAGGDRLTWLDSMSSQSLRALAPGESAETLLLDPAGHIEHALHVVDDGETTWLLVERSDTDAVLDFLQKMRFMLRVDPADRTSDYATIGAIGEPEAVTEFIASAGGVRVSWSDPWPAVVTGGHQYARSTEPHPGSDYHWVEAVVSRQRLDALAELAASGGIQVAGTMAAEALRIAAWRPRRSAEVDERSIPHELDWLRTAVHLSKGCYRGQETIAKVHNLGHPPRRIVFLHIDGSEGIEVSPGAEVLAGEVVVGRVTSTAVHHELGPIALAVVKRSTDPSIDLVLHTEDGDVAAAQEVIVPTDAGAEAHVPRIPRLGAVTREPRNRAAR